MEDEKSMTKDEINRHILRLNKIYNVLIWCMIVIAVIFGAFANAAGDLAKISGKSTVWLICGIFVATLIVGIIIIRCVEKRLHKYYGVSLLISIADSVGDRHKEDMD